MRDRQIFGTATRCTGLGIRKKRVVLASRHGVRAGGLLKNTNVPNAVAVTL
jgi:hypothetical protein